MFTSIINYFRRPVIIVTLANDDNDGLDLDEEEEGIENALKRAVIRKQVKLDCVHSARYKDIHKRLRVHENRVCIYHFAGHSNGSSILFEDQKGDGDSLAERIGMEKNIKLVFLNGCSNKAQLKYFFAAGIDAIIATNSKVHDEDAINLSKEFYIALSNGSTIEQAFKKAKTFVNGKSRNKEKIDKRNLRDIPDEGIKEEEIEEIAETKTDMPKEKKTNEDSETKANLLEEKTEENAETRGLGIKKNAFPWGLYPNPNKNVRLDWKLPPPSWQIQFFVLFPLVFSVIVGLATQSSKTPTVTLCIKEPNVEVFLKKEKGVLEISGKTNKSGCVEFKFQKGWELGDSMRATWEDANYNEPFKLRNDTIPLK